MNIREFTSRHEPTLTALSVFNTNGLVLQTSLDNFTATSVLSVIYGRYRSTSLTGMLKGSGTGIISVTGTAGYAAYWADANTVGSEQYLANTRGGTAQNSSGWTGIPYVTSGTWSSTSSLAVNRGGTGLASSGAAGNLLISDGNGWASVTMGTDATIASNGALTIADNAVDGTDISISSEANGSLMYFDGTNWVNLAAGTSGQLLKANGAAAPAWASTSTLGFLSTSAIGSGTPGWMPYYAGYGSDLTATSSIFIDSNGNIGIGTTSPNNRLEVKDLIVFKDAAFKTQLGYQAGLYDKGPYNSYIGYQSGYGSSTASTGAAMSNTAVGYQSLYSNTIGSENTAIGRAALNLNTTGQYNSALGFNALSANTTGSSNTAIGYGAIDSNTTGSYNSVLGTGALQSIKTGSANTALGYFAGFGLTDNSFASTTLIGYEAGYSLTTASGTVAIGYQAGRSNTSGTNNTYLGYKSGYSNQTGNSVTALGYEAGYSNSSGAYNVFIGHNAGYSVTTGGSSTIVGVQAGYFANSSASGNTLFGYKAGYGNATRTYHNNTLIGNGAGLSLMTGSNNTLLGYMAGNNLGYGNNNIIIGYNINATSSAANNQLNIGNLLFGTLLDGTDTTLSSGNIGVGTNTPLAKLAVQADASTDELLRVANSSSQNLLQVNSLGYTGIGASTSPAYRLHVASSDANYLGYFYNSSTATSAGGLYVRSDGDGNLLTLNANGTDVLTVSPSQALFNVPVTFASAGDVSLSYDLYFDNDTAAYIKFQGPGYIETESSDQNLNLTLRAANSGKVIADDIFLVTGNFGIGTDTPGAMLSSRVPTRRIRRYLISPPRPVRLLCLWVRTAISE